MSVLVVGGYGVVGAQVCALLAERNPGLEIMIGGRSLAKARQAASGIAGALGVRIDVEDEDPLAGLPKPPAAIVVAVNDHHDRLLLAAARRGIALVDIARWRERMDDARRLLESAEAPVVLASGWMAGAAAVVAAAFRDPARPADRVDIDILFDLADKAGPDSIAGFMDIQEPFTVWEAGVPRTAKSLSEGRVARFSDRSARCLRFDSPDQQTLVQSGHARGAATRMTFGGAAMTATFAVLVRSGLWGLLPRAARAALLYNPGKGAPHEFVVTLDEAAGAKRIVVRDGLGQTHMTAAGAAAQAERMLGLNGRAPVARGVSYPEQADDLAADIAALRAMGVEIVGP